MTRIDALRELARWDVCTSADDCGCNRKIEFKPRGFDVTLATLERRSSGDAPHNVDLLIRAIRTVVLNGLPRPKKRSRR